MKDNFKLYSEYYDLLYQDKDYHGEAKYVIDLINHYRPGSKSILELGSGTGKHAKLFSAQGFTVLGLEKSEEMVNIANSEHAKNVEFRIADIADFKLEEGFDVALSLFHVISYLTDNDSLINCFNNVSDSLNEKGLFIFDVWHSAAVNDQVPEKRNKTFNNELIEVNRQATPTIFHELNTVDVDYTIHIKNLEDQTTSTFHEKHSMRHFSKPEIELLAYATGFSLLAYEAYLTKDKPSTDTWGVCYILQKK